MTSQTDEQLIISYLLGELPEEDQTRLEERFLREAEYRELIRAVEDDLIDDYIRGELGPHERELFEKHFTSLPHRRQKLEFARALTRSFTEQRPTHAGEGAAGAFGGRDGGWWKSLWSSLTAPGWPLGFSLAAAAVLLVLGGVWLITYIREAQREGLQAGQEQRQRPRQEVTPQPTVNQSAPGMEERAGQQGDRQQQEGNVERTAQQTERGQGQSDSMKGQANNRTPRPQQRAAIASFILPPSPTRGSGETREFVIPGGARLVRLRLDLERGDEYPGYRAELRTMGGNPVWRSDTIRARPTAAGQAVVLSLPSGTLTSGKYELTLSGINNRQAPEAIGYYYFSILKK